jgi:hypothetical protein
MADLSRTTSSPTGTGSINGAAHGTTRIMDKMRDAATAQLSSQKERATDGLGSISQAVRQSTHQLRDQEHDVMAHYVEQAAEQIDRLSQRLRDRDVGELVGDIQQMARRRPALFIGGAFAVGLIGARFLKSSGRTSPRNGQRERNALHETAFNVTSNDAGMEAGSSARPTPTRTAPPRPRQSSPYERP